MSLINFHRGLIAAGIVFCFGYGIWELAGLARPEPVGSLGLGVVFIVLGCGLVYYLIRLNRFLGYEEEGREGRAP